MTHIAAIVQIQTRCPRCGGVMVRMGIDQKIPSSSRRSDARQ